MVDPPLTGGSIWLRLPLARTIFW